VIFGFHDFHVVVSALEVVDKIGGVAMNDPMAFPH
jgi:hypothetical protein